MNNFIITIKQNDEVLKQSTLSENDAFKLLGNAIAAIYSDSSSADLARLAIVAKLKQGIAQAIEYNGRMMVLQTA